MRILHTSDWHLGRTFHGQVLDDAHAAFADHLVEVVTTEPVDAVLVSGDVYDRAVPPSSAVTLLDQTLRRLTERTRVVLTPGNHDSAHRLGFAADLMTDRLVIRARTADAARGIILPDAQGREAAIVHALPYLDPDTARESLPRLLADQLGEEGEPAGPAAQASPTDSAAASTPGRRPHLPRSHEAVVSAALRLVAADLERQRSARTRRLASLVMAHAFVVGGTASSSERDIRVGGVDAVPSQVFSDLGGSALAGACGGTDYVALGHLHRPQEIHHPAGEGTRAPRLVYSGSPLALSFDEAEDVGRTTPSASGTGPSVTSVQSAKSSVLLEVGPRGVVSLERVPVPVRHRVHTVRGTMEELLSPATQDAARPGSWVRVVLHGDRPPGALAVLRRRFPGLLSFHHEIPHRSPHERVTATADTDPVTLVTSFLGDVGGRPPDEPERTVLRDAYEAALRSGGGRP